MSSSEIRVNLSALEHNVRVLRSIVGPDCALCPIVKADAYGLGVAKVARHLEAAGADMMAVYSLDQAAAIARAAVGKPILVLTAVRELDRIDETYRLLIQGRLHLTVHDPDHLQALMELSDRFATFIRVHLEVDTGMGRGGCDPADVEGMLGRIESSRWLRLAGVFTHFANASKQSARTTKQMDEFERILDRVSARLPEDCHVHVASTYGVLRARRFHQTMVRFGLAWAGYGPECMTGGEFRREAAELVPIVSWHSRVVHVKPIERGAAVGYGSTWTARRPSLLGIVPVGYADGYPLGLGGRDDDPRPACVGVLPEGAADSDSEPRRFVPVVGRVNMDQIMIDLTDVSRRLPVGPGTPVELIGTDPAAPNHLPRLARTAGTLPHEFLCRLHPRVKRVYVARPVPERSGEDAPPGTARRAGEVAQTVAV